MTTHSKEINGKTTLPLSLTWQFIVLAVMLTGAWYDLRSHIENALSRQDAQEWIDNARESNPLIKWPRLPDHRAIVKPSVILTEAP